MSADTGHRRKRACGEGVGTTKGHHVGLRVWARLAFAMQHCICRFGVCSCTLCALGVFGEGVGAACLRYAALHLPVRGVLVHALCAWRVWWNTAACRDVGDNNLGGELPAQYSALTSLQFWCVAPYLTRSGVAFGRLAVDDLWSRFDSSLWTSLAAT